MPFNGVPLVVCIYIIGVSYINHKGIRAVSRINHKGIKEVSRINHKGI